MHELAITQGLFDVIMEQAKQSGAKRVGGINLIIGEMTGVAGASVQYYVNFLSKGTIAEGVALNIKVIPAQVRCRNCDKTFELGELIWNCPDCGGTDLEITGGKELFIDSIEVD